MPIVISKGIARETLTDEIKLKIDKTEEIQGLQSSLDEYFELLKDYMDREKFPMFIHTREVF